MTRPALLALLLAAAAVAQDRKRPEKASGPRLTVAVPLTVEPGAKAKLVVRGRNLDGVTGVKVHEPNSKGTLVGKPKKVMVPMTHPADRIGDWEAEVELEVAKGVPGGRLGFSLVGPAGESTPATVAVADGTPRVAEKEPNDGFAQAQPVPAKCVIDGAIGRGRDPDVYRFDGKAGRTVRVEVQAARLGSPLDAILTVYDAERRIVGTCDDANGSADPVLVLRLPRDGVYYAAVIDANDLGGPAFAYRLVIGE